MRKYSLTVSYRLRFSTVNPAGTVAGRRPQNAVSAESWERLVDLGQTLYQLVVLAVGNKSSAGQLLGFGNRNDARRRLGVVS